MTGFSFSLEYNVFSFFLKLENILQLGNNLLVTVTADCNGKNMSWKVMASGSHESVINLVKFLFLHV